MGKYKITKKELEELQNAFLHYSQGEAKISGQNLQKLFGKYELNFQKNELKDIIQSNDYNKNGTLEFNEFVNILLFKKSEDLSREYRMIFRQFDKNQDGTISVQELKLGMLMMGEDMSEAEIEELIKSIDRNNNSRIDIEEFIGFLKEKEFT